MKPHSTAGAPRKPTYLALACSVVLASLLLSGCLEQIESPHVPSGSMNNFFLHLYAGELNDARAYFAPGLVTPSAQLDQSLQDASDRLRRYDIQRGKVNELDLPGGEEQVTLTGKVRPRTPAGQPTPAPYASRQDTDILTARMIVRGPGWRILDFSLKCCP